MTDVIKISTGNIFESITELIDDLREQNTNTVLIAWRMNDGDVKKCFLTDDHILLLGILRDAEGDIINMVNKLAEL